MCCRKFRKSFLELTTVALAFLTATCFGSNPFITSIYCADPSAHVWLDGRLYVYPSHDVDPPLGSNLMDRYHVFSTTDMVHWRDEGEILRASEITWSGPPGGFMWAPDCAYANGKYYFYFPHPSDPSGTNWNYTWKIGVAVSLSPCRDFTPLTNYIQGVGGFSMIDPAVFVDTDGQAYLYYGGGGNCVGVKLKSDMTEIDGDVQPMTNLVDFHEATWVFKRNGIYYLTYADNNPSGNQMRYATSSVPLGPWTYQGIYMGPADSGTTHGSVVEYHGQWYQFYHDDVISGQGNLRSLCVDVLNFDTNGNILPLVETTNGPPANGPAPPPSTNTIIYSVTNGIVGNGAVFVSDNAAWDGWCIQNMHISTNTFFELSDVDGGPNGGLTSMDIHFATQDTGVKLRVTVNGEDYSFINTLYTGGWSTFTGDSYLTIPLGPGPTNVIRFNGGNGGINPDYVAFTSLPLPPWNAQIETDKNFGFRSNQFGFDVCGADWTFAVDAATNLNNPIWSPLATNTILNGGITNGMFYFSDNQWTNYSARFYRVRSP
jgi:Glycosyl hydrolases family 43